MARTTSEKIRAVIDIDAELSVDQFITTASALTDYVSSQDTQSILSSALLTEIETYLAAHYAALKEQQYRAKKTGDASATFQGQSGKRLDATDWGQQAIALDISGTLAKVNSGIKRVSISWLGSTEAEKQDWYDRNPTG